MRPADDHASIHDVGSIYGAPSGGLRYMRRRRVGTAERNGDPLYGLANLFVIGIVLAVGFLVAALTAAGVAGLLTAETMTIVTNPGSPDMQVVVKEKDHITKLDTTHSAQVQGVGTLLGSFYTLADGTVVYVPAGSAPSGTTTPSGTGTTPSGTGATPAPGTSGSPMPTTTDYPTTDPYASPTPSAAPTPEASSTP